jgi:K+-sensing histidine kinase KdpD
MARTNILSSLLARLEGNVRMLEFSPSEMAQTVTEFFAEAGLPWIGDRTVIRRYGFAFLFVALALVFSLPLQRLFVHPFLFLFFAAVMASAWYGSTGPGLLAVLLSTVVVDYFFVQPLYSFAVNATEVAYLVAFVACALVASWVSSVKRETEEELRQARDQLEIRVAERTAELRKTIEELRENERQRMLLDSEKSALSDKLEARKVVERAKGILQRKLGISEEEAYRTVQRESQQRRKTMKEISESIILNEEIKRKAQ